MDGEQWIQAALEAPSRLGLLRRGTFIDSIIHPFNQLHRPLCGTGGRRPRWETAVETPLRSGCLDSVLSAVAH